jgi:hypothetical protein
VKKAYQKGPMDRLRRQAQKTGTRQQNQAFIPGLKDRKTVSFYRNKKKNLRNYLECSFSWPKIEIPLIWAVKEPPAQERFILGTDDILPPPPSPLSS